MFFCSDDRLPCQPGRDPPRGQCWSVQFLPGMKKCQQTNFVGTIILERLVDAITLVSIFAITIILQPGLYSQFVERVINRPGEEETKKYRAISSCWSWSRLWPWWSPSGWSLKRKRSKTCLSPCKKDWLARMGRSERCKTSEETETFYFYSILLWGLYLIAGYLGFCIKRNNWLWYQRSFYRLVAGSIGMTITPGGIGGYAFFLENDDDLWIVRRCGFCLPDGCCGCPIPPWSLSGVWVSFAALPWYNKKKLQQSAI